MLSPDRAGRVIHASSFSKTVSPGVRVGYLAGPAEQIQTLAKRGSEHYISPNMLAESMVLELCRSGALARNIEFVNGALAERRDALVEALARADPRGRVRRPRRRLLPLARPRRRRRHARAARGRQARRASPSSPAPTSCSRAARRACASRSRASPPSGSPRASRGSRGRSRRSAPAPRPSRRTRPLRRDLRVRLFSTKMIEKSLYPDFTKRLHPPAARSKRWRGQSEQRRWGMSPVQIIEGSTQARSGQRAPPGRAAVLGARRGGARARGQRAQARVPDPPAGPGALPPPAPDLRIDEDLPASARPPSRAQRP